MPGKSIAPSSEERESSQIDSENPAVETPTAPSRPRTPDKECQDSEGEDPTATDEGDENDQDSTASRKRLVTIKTSRKLRSAAARQKPTQSESPILSQAETPTLRKRGREEHEDEAEYEAVRPGKRGRKPAVHTEVKKFETTIHGLLEDFKSKAHDLETSKTKNQELRLQISSLKKDLKKVQHALQDREDLEESQILKINQLQNECSIWRQRLEKAIDDAKQDSGRYTKFADSDITMEWGKLSFNIRDLVFQCLVKSPINECDGIETLMKRLKRQLPLLYCDVASLRIAVLRRMIWDTIILSVFSGKRPSWHGKAGQMLTQLVFTKGQIYHSNSCCLEMISHMKFRAINDLSEEPHLDELAENVIDDAIDAAENSLFHFLPQSKVECFRNMMKGLILNARDLHTMMMKSKAIFLLQWLGDDEGKFFDVYNSNSMESRHGDVDVHRLHCTVSFVEAPALVKYGNADGEGFEFSTILSKASVILREMDDVSTWESETMPGRTSHDEASNDLSNVAAGPKIESEQ